MLAAIPRASSVGWFGCSRTEKRPGRPTVLRKRVTTLHLAATIIRSCRRMSLLTAATISGVRPGARALRAAVSAVSPSSQSRRPPTVRCATGAKAAASWVSMMRRVTSSVSYGTRAWLRKSFSGTSASANCAATRCSAEAAANPASTSPLRSGEAHAIKVARSLKTWFS